MLIEGSKALFGRGQESVGQLKRVGQGDKRAAVYRWPYIWTGVEGGLKVMVLCLMEGLGERGCEAAKGRGKIIAILEVLSR